jgi:aspartyl-tRNA(Asn)/glutamyl-tRNA(Gln) amidotransferase subunit A
MTDLTRRSASELASALAAGEDHVRRADPGLPRPHRRRGRRLRARGTRLPARRRRRSAGAGPRLRRPPRSAHPASHLDGVPIAVKDIVATRGVPTTARLRHPRGLAPAVRRTVTERLRAAGVVVPRQDQHGRVRDGLLHRAQRVRPDLQPVGPHPHPGRQRRRLGAAVAAYEAPLAIGTDTGGSIRQPAGRHRHGRRQADLRRRLPLRA